MPRYVQIIISETDPSTVVIDKNYLWFDTVNKVWKAWDGEQYVEVEDMKALTDLTISGKLTVTGQIWAENKKGINETIQLAEGTLKFKHGILHSWTPA